MTAEALGCIGVFIALICFFGILWASFYVNQR
jgi:cell division protein FtsW (lipid II flippase)